LSDFFGIVNVVSDIFRQLNIDFNKKTLKMSGYQSKPTGSPRLFADIPGFDWHNICIIEIKIKKTSD
jgi:hypothetical protein